MYVRVCGWAALHVMEGADVAEWLVMELALGEASIYSKLFSS